MSLQDAGLEHGGICKRNVCLDQSVQLIDFGERAPNYINDIIATAFVCGWRESTGFRSENMRGGCNCPYGEKLKVSSAIADHEMKFRHDTRN